MSDIKQDVKGSVEVFTQTFVSKVVKESTKKLIKNLTLRQKKLLEARVKNLSDDHLEQHIGNNFYFNDSLENTVKSVKSIPTSKESESWLEKTQSVYEATFSKSLIKIFNLPAYNKILASMAGIALLIIIALSVPEAAPVANFSSNVTEGSAPLTIIFTDLSQNAEEWRWNFGDGNNSNRQNVTHTFFAEGDYNVSLEVTNGKRSDSANLTIKVLKDTLPVFPVANFSSNVTTGFVPLTVQFNDSSENETGWEWDFGDRTYSPEENPVHIYQAAGNYNVSLTVTNEYGTSSKNATITVLPVYAYITNSGSSSLSIIDTTTNRVTSDVVVGKRPYGIAVTPDKTKVYVTNSGSNTVSVIDTSTGDKVAMPAGTPYVIAINPDVKTTATVSVGSTPRGIAVTPDGMKVYVANSGSNDVSIIDTSTDKVVATLKAGAYPWGVAVTPNGTKVYVANSGSNDVSVIDTANNTIISTVPAGNRPYGVAVTKDGKKVYVTNHNSNSVSVIDTVNNSLINAVSVGSGPYGVAVNPEGTKVYVANYNSNNISVINTTTNNVTETINVGEKPEGVAVSPDGKKVYVANSGSNNVSIIDIATNSTTAVNVGILPAAFGQFIGYFPTPSADNKSKNNSTHILPVVPGHDTYDPVPDPRDEYGIDQKDYEQLLFPVASFNSNVTEGYAPLPVRFTDLSQNAISWSWDFDNDGNSDSNIQNTAYVYEIPGIYTVNLSAGNLNGTSSKTATITVLQAEINKGLPVANFSLNVSEGYAPLSVLFTDLSQTATSRSWDVNSDGIEDSTASSFVYEYTASGNYTINLTAVNANGTNSKTGTIIVLEKILPPVANFSSNETSGTAPLPVQFTDLSENATEWNWDFGDKNTSTEQNPVHTYTAKGTYTVVLTVTNANGTDTKNATIIISSSCCKCECASALNAAKN